MSGPVPQATPPPGVTLYDKDGSPVVVDAKDAPAHILNGQYGYAAGTKVPVKIRGQIGTVDADQLGDAFAKSGATPVSSADYHHAEFQQQYGGTGHAVLAATTGALDTATLGASNAFIGGIGGQGVRETIRKSQEANPTATTAGEVLGFVAPVVADVLSGGTLTPELVAAEAARGAARTAERGIIRTAAETALLGPTRALSRIGEIAESAAKAVVGTEAETRAGRVAQSIIAGGTRGVAEGGIVGAGQEVGHQFLQDDPNLTGEALGTAWVHGAVMGGALGGAFHGVGSLLSRKAGAFDRALETEGQAGAIRESTVVENAARSIIDRVEDPKTKATLERAWKARDFKGHDSLLTDASRNVTEHLNTSLEAGHTVDMASFGEMKADQMAKLVPADNIGPARKAALDIWADATNVIAELESQAAKGGQEGSVKRLGKWLKDFASETVNERKAQWKDPADIFNRIDSFKRNVGKEAAFGTSPFGRTEAAHQFESLYERIRLGLEDESTWGAAGKAQKEINAATTDMLGTSRKFEASYTTRYGDKAGVPMYVADPAKVSSFVNNLTSASNDLNLKMFADRIDARTAYLDALERNYDFAPNVKAAIATERKALATMGETIGKTGNEVAHINQLKSILAEEGGHAGFGKWAGKAAGGLVGGAIGAVGGHGIGAIVGHGIGHGLGGIVGAAIDSVTKPGLSLARLAELEATKTKTIAKLTDGLESVKAALRGRKRPGLTPSLDADTYEKRRAAVVGAASKPDDLHAHLTGSAAPIGQHAPDTARAFQGAGLRTIQYLMTALPKPAPRPDSLTPQVDLETWNASDQQKSQFDRKFDAAMAPEHMLQHVADGTITAQHVEAWQQTRPAMLDHSRKLVKAEMASLKKPVKFEMQAPLKTFLGMPQTDPFSYKLSQAAYTLPPAHAKGIKRPLKLEDHTSLNVSISSKERL